MQFFKNIKPNFRTFLRFFCFFGIHYYKTKEYSMTTFVVKEYCECKNCEKLKVFVSENDSI
jgi:hypothetical protein